MCLCIQLCTVRVTHDYELKSMTKKKIIIRNLLNCIRSNQLYIFICIIELVRYLPERFNDRPALAHIY